MRGLKQKSIFAMSAVWVVLAACGRAPMSPSRGDDLPDFSAPSQTQPPAGGPGASSLPARFPTRFEPPAVATLPAATPAPISQPEVGPPAPPAEKSSATNDRGKTFTPLRAAAPSAESLKVFESSGRPRFQFTSRLAKEFGRRLNHPEALGSKSERVFKEMQKVANREVATEKSLLFMPVDEARKWSLEVERTGRSPMSGAWSIAVKQTAVRHKFPAVPCAEFVSEVVREAYARAEVDINDDFNRVNTNRLIWSETASVAGLKKALLRAGWVPWNAHEFVPPIGAIMMNGTGETPGHVYLAAGHGGRFVVDNGAPGGRDLGATSVKTLKEMYSAGVFFLPPGVNPTRWR